LGLLGPKKPPAARPSSETLCQCLLASQRAARACARQSLRSRRLQARLGAPQRRVAAQLASPVRRNEAGFFRLSAKKASCMHTMQHSTVPKPACRLCLEKNFFRVFQKSGRLAAAFLKNAEKIFFQRPSVGEGAPPRLLASAW